MQPKVKNDYDYMNWKGWDSEAFGTYTKEESLTFLAEIQRAGVALSGKTRVLEIGFGNGSFAGWIRKSTGHYVGMESNRALVARANAVGIVAHLSTVSDAITSGQKFDLVVAFDVVEHMVLEDVATALRAWRESLSHDGRIIIRIPSGDSPFSGRVMYGDITHKTLLGTSALQQLAALAELDLVATYPPALPILGLGPKKAVERAMVVLARKLATSLINAVFHGNRHGVVTSNLVAIFKTKAIRP